MAAKLNAVVAAAVTMVFAAGACLRAASAFPSSHQHAFEDENEAAAGFPQPEHYDQHHHYAEPPPPPPPPSHPVRSYHFQYAVNDPLTGDEKSHNEVSDGHGTVTGTYTVVEPDGSKRVVEYTADDEHGFRAEVKKIVPPKTVHGTPHYAYEKLEHQKSPPQYDAVNDHEQHRYHYVPESYPSH